MAHIHGVVDMDKHFVIDAATREIKNCSGKMTLMQEDHNSECFTFEIPKEIDGHDMSLCNSVQVRFVNTDSATRAKKSGKYDITDFQINPDNSKTMIGTWVISRHATEYAGSLDFSISFKCKSADGVIEYSWSTHRFNGIHILPKIPGVDEDFIPPESILAEIEAVIAESGLTDREKIVDNVKQLLAMGKYHKAIEEYVTDGVDSRGRIFSYNPFIKEIVSFDFSGVRSFANLFQGCTNLERVVIENHIATSYSRTFVSCSNLKSLKTLDLSKVTNISAWLNNCDNLEELLFVPETIRNDVIIPCPKLNDESIQSIIDGLQQIQLGLSITLTVDSSVYKRITDEQWAVIQAKNWHIA